MGQRQKTRRASAIELLRLLEAGIREVTLVAGYRREQVMLHAKRRYPQVEFSVCVNHHFFETNTAYSLWVAGEEFLDRDFVYLNGDVLFEPRLLARVLESPHMAALAVEAKQCGDEEVKVICERDGRVRQIGKQLDPRASLGEFIGVARFDAPFTAYFFQALDALKHAGERNAYFEAALDMMADDHPFFAVDVSDFPCIEIDFPEDYEAAKRSVLTRFESKR